MTDKQIIAYVEKRVDNMLSRPRMFFMSSESLITMIHEYALMLREVRGLERETKLGEDFFSFHRMGIACGFARVDDAAVHYPDVIDEELTSKLRKWWDSLPPSPLERLAETGSDRGRGGEAEAEAEPTVEELNKEAASYLNQPYNEAIPLFGRSFAGEIVGALDRRIARCQAMKSRIVDIFHCETFAAADWELRKTNLQLAHQLRQAINSMLWHARFSGNQDAYRQLKGWLDGKETP